jgi:hypothetical protein
MKRSPSLATTSLGTTPSRFSNQSMLSHQEQ